ncbi:hypothetical protein DSBG_4526 [Desulfosporosinus sp. BG]|nr:hypothetical protein DSBG_4526 [Desulfosporosinus sp. BG]
MVATYINQRNILVAALQQQGNAGDNTGTVEHRGTVCRGCCHAEVGNGAGD